MLRTGLLQQEEYLLSAGVSDPLLNQKLYSACSNTVARIHLHKQGNYADKPRAAQWNHPSTMKTETCSKSRGAAAAAQLPTYHLQTSWVVPRALPTLLSFPPGGKNIHTSPAYVHIFPKNTYIPCLKNYIYPIPEVKRAR